MPVRSTTGEVVFLGRVLSVKTNICRLNFISSWFLVRDSTYSETQAARHCVSSRIGPKYSIFFSFHLPILRHRIITILLDEHVLPNVQDGLLLPGTRAHDAYGWRTPLALLTTPKTVFASVLCTPKHASRPSKLKKNQSNVIQSQTYNSSILCRVTHTVPDPK